MEDLAQWSAGAHVRVDAALANSAIMPYLQIGYVNELGQPSSAGYLNARTRVAAFSGLFQGDLGLEARLGNQLSLFAQGGLTEGTDSDTSGHSAKVGAKLTW